jgi:uncharacterized protein (TIGR02594 family)
MEEEQMEITPYSIASTFLGTAEVAGAIDNPRILSWLAPWWGGEALHDEVAWCGAFVAEIALRSGCKVPKLPLRARSWLTAGTVLKPAEERRGWDVVVFKRKDEDPGFGVLDAPGHVAFLSGRIYAPGADPLTGVVEALGGNQSNRVSVARFPARLVLGVVRLVQTAA